MTSSDTTKTKPMQEQIEIDIADHHRPHRYLDAKIKEELKEQETYREQRTIWIKRSTRYEQMEKNQRMADVPGTAAVVDEAIAIQMDVFPLPF